VAIALAAGDPLALAAVTMAVTGCRPGEVLALRARDVDDGGAVLHVDGAKTEAARRMVHVDPAFQPMLLGIARTKAPTALLFDFEGQRSRKTKDPDKARRDALLRRVRQLYRAAGVPEVVSHSMRGLNATLRKTGGADDTSITRALGHVGISTTRRHYFAPGVAEAADQRRAHGRLLSSAI
jgi:integrase